MKKNLFIKLHVFLLFLTIPFLSKAITKSNAVDSSFNLTQHSSIYIDTPGTATINTVIRDQKKFKPHHNQFINFSKITNIVWLKAEFPSIIKNLDEPSILIDQARLEIADIYFVKNNQVIFKIEGERYSTVADLDYPGNTKSYRIPLSISKLHPEIYIRLFSDEVIIAPVYISSNTDFYNIFAKRDIFFGIYTGIMIIMFAYNMFLYFSVKDSSYLNYIFCIVFTWATQMTLQGYLTKYILINNSWFNNIAVILFSNLGLIASILFTQSFLNTKKYAPKSNKIINILLILSIINTILLLFGFKQMSFTGMQILILAGSIIGTHTAYLSFFTKKFKPAGYYLASWSFLFVGMLIFILKDYEIIPYTTFSKYAVQFTSVIEVMLLSFALADRINFFKAENELSQKQALEISKENEELIREQNKLITEQNIVLENKVNERTTELQNANSTLNITLSNLKSAQSQLVDSEKMASLGQLTAGIAHEINNPINFVTSNIKPLELDINDLNEVINKYESLDFSGNINEQISAIESFKSQIDLDYVREEITSLLSGIGDGAKRTAEIIRSLKNFSRLDENDTKPVNLNEGLDSTLVLIKNTFPSNLSIIKDYSALPEVECMPGKINQVFMNLITNAVQAVKSKPVQDPQELISLKTWSEGDFVKLSIKDSGTGMSEEVKQKIFEPFFTTKDVGEGTGLGLSIVFRIIESHHGTIDVESKLSEGTEFIITLPVNNR